jgi:glycosyltransferase involved in cell wall biosynthesis
LGPDRSAVFSCFANVTRLPIRVLIIASHPVQYSSPIFRMMARDPRIEVQVAYCAMLGAETHLDPDFGVEVKWDIPLLDGYPWVALRNRAPHPRVGAFFGLVNLDVWSVIRKGKFDAVIAYTGYAYATFWIALLASKLRRIPFLFGTDAHELTSRDKKKWKLWIKKRVWPRLYRYADKVLVPSTAGVNLMRSLGIPQTRIGLTPYTVDNEWWIEQANKSNRLAVRNRLGIPPNAIVIVFSAKLQPWKRPHDLLRAFANIGMDEAYLVFVGDGLLRSALESEAKSLGIAEKVRFLGFLNQSALPATYEACDVLALTSEYEPFGVVVNEAMLCRCCAVVSDRVGAGFDLVRDGETGFTFPVGDIDALSRILRALVQDPVGSRLMGQAARERMKTWSPADNIDGTVKALEDCVWRSSAPSNRN